MSIPKKLLILSWVFALAACSGNKPEQKAEAKPEQPAPASFKIAPDLSMSDAGTGGPANLQQAAQFAWSEFILLNWPALANTRDQLDPNKLFGQPNYTGPLVWQTYRGKDEIFPGLGDPHGYNQGAPDYGYNDPPKYVYGPAVSPTGPSGIAPDGMVIPCPGQAPVAQPAWVNLDEINEIGLNQMYAGTATTSPVPGQQMLFMAKANKAEYTYVAANQWYGKTAPPFSATGTYVTTQMKSPPAGGSQYVSFNPGTVEVKAAWRRLTSTEKTNGRFHIQTVRFYDTTKKFNKTVPCYREEQWGLLALHIIQKTAGAPYFVFATFGQADNMLTASGQKIEDENGNLLTNQNATPMDPQITSQNATSANPTTPQSIQKLTPPTANCQPGQQLYYINSTADTGTPQGQVCIQKRFHNIPQTIIDVNTNVHNSIKAYNQRNNIQSSPWLYYKLVNVQAAPINKPTPGMDYSGPDVATYYQANIVVETDYNLQVFSGQFQPKDSQLQNTNTFGLITDFNTNGTPFHNVYYNGKAYNMGGCMGCHGNAQVGGADFSFIMLGQRVTAPETAGPAGLALAKQKFQKLLQRAK